MRFPLLPKRKVDTISNGVFLILLGVLFYTGKWWPGILFALGLTLAIRLYLRRQRINFFMTIIWIGLLGLLFLAGQAFCVLLPVLLIAMGFFLIAKECLFLQEASYWKPSVDSQQNKD